MKAGAPAGTKRILHLSSEKQEESYKIVISNPRSMPDEILNFLNDQDLNIPSFKFNKLIKETGGTSIIKKIVQKNNWIMNISSSENLQETVVTLTIK